MAIKYYKLMDLLNRREMKRTDLLKIMSPSTLAKLGKGDIIKSSVINEICKFLNCQPGDIMEYIPDEPKKTMGEKLKEATVGSFERTYKVTKEAPTKKEAMKEVGGIIKETWKGDK